MRTEIRSMLIHYALSFFDSRNHKLESKLNIIEKLHFDLLEYGTFHTKKIVFLISRREILKSGNIRLFSPLTTND